MKNRNKVLAVAVALSIIATHSIISRNKMSACMPENVLEQLNTQDGENKSLKKIKKR
ncbi:MAG: hypothetical protein WC343_15500 [Bacilli bacterium]|jgi:hypothetical protein